MQSLLSVIEEADQSPVAKYRQSLGIFIRKRGVSGDLLHKKAGIAPGLL
jgi:hypothetical protein